MRLVALLRVSGRTQARDGHGLEAQQRRIRAWAKTSGVEGVRIVKWVREEGISGGAALGDRDGIIEALGMIRAEKADGIVVASLDRLSRDLVIQEQVWAEVAAAGGVLRSTLPAEDHALARDDADPTRALVRRIFASIAAYERDVMRLRLAAGRAAKLAAGGYCHGRPPYGWVASGKDLVPLDAEQRVIRDMKARRQRGESLPRIAAALNEDGIPTKMGGTWSPNGVRQVLIRCDRPRKLVRKTISSPPPLNRKAGSDRDLAAV